MKLLLTLLAVSTLVTIRGSAQMSQPLVHEETNQVSEHVWALMGAEGQVSA